MKFLTPAFALAIAIMATLSACSKPVNTVDFYIENQDSRTSTMLRCQKIPRDQRKRDEDCNNAFIALATVSGR